MTWRSLAFVCQNTFRTHCPCTPLLCATQLVSPHLQAMHYGKEVLCHELVVFFDNHRASCSHMQWPSILHQQSAIGKVTHPRMHLKRFVKLRELKYGQRRQLAPKLP